MKFKKIIKYILNFFKLNKKPIFYINLNDNIEENAKELDLLLKYAITSYNKEFMAVRENEQKYKRILDASNDFVFLKDQTGKYLIANKALQNNFNKKEEEIIGKTDFELMDNIIAKRCAISDKLTLLSDNIYTGIEETDNKIYEVRKIRVKLPDNKFGISGFIRDVTDEYKSVEKIATLTDTCLNLSNNYLDNINILVKVGCHLLDAKCAIYNKIEETYLCSFARYGIPNTFPTIFYHDDTLIGRILNSNFYKDSILIKDLQNSQYKNDIIVKQLNVKSYFAHIVTLNKIPIGIFILLYDNDFHPKEIDHKIISLIAGLLEAEERRNSSERNLLNILPKD